MIYASESGNLRLGLIGDVMLSRRLVPFDEPAFLALRDLLAGTDATFANLETVVRAPGEGYPNHTQGTPMATDPELLADLAWFGIDFVSAANNHATDWGVSGVAATVAHLRRAGIPFAGLGANLAEARAPAYLDTRVGRVALVAATSFFRPWNRAANQRPDAPGRPGINPLGFETTHRVTPDAFAALEGLAAGLGLDKAKRRMKSMFYSDSEVPDDSGAEMTLFERKFARADEFGLATEADAADLEGNLRAIREARRQADWVVASIHAHDFGGATAMSAERDIDMEEPADFVRAFAHAAIDAGADVVAGHGPHLTLGAEIHAGKPILYSLGNAVFENDTIAIVPDESYRRFGLGSEATPADFLDARTDGGRKGFPVAPEYWHGIAAVCEFKDRGLEALTLHPIDLGHGRPRAQRGRPVIAEGETAAAILARVERLSRVLGTKVRIKDGVARVELPA